MKRTTFTYTSTNGTVIFARKWSPIDGSAPKAVIQIAHGMAEHSERYDDFAAFLVKEGYTVYANDHRGHGYTLTSSSNYGYFADENGFDEVADDLLALTKIIEQNHKNIPIFLFGHSMGSFLVRRYIQVAGIKLKGAILSGTAGNPGILGKVGKIIARSEIIKKGKSYPSPLLSDLAFGSHNKSFEPSRTGFDWLSSDNESVDNYIEDSLSGGTCTTGFFYDLFTGLERIHDPKRNALIPKTLPIFIFSGDRDPVGKDGKAVEATFRMYQKLDIKDVLCKIYKNGRHEMLHEVNKAEVYGDIKNWIEQRL